MFQIKVHTIDDPQLESRDPLVLPGDTIHVWQAFVPRFKGRLPELDRVLSRDERVKADRFLFEADRMLFVVAHGILRMLLGRYLNRLPDQVVFDKGPNGKPGIPGSFNIPPLYFNISHSHELAVLAFSTNYTIGVDVEYLRCLPDCQGIAHNYFHPDEADLLRKTSTDKKRDLFYECWTQKEAFIKGTGEGLSRSLDSFAVFPGRDGRNGIGIHGGNETDGTWSVLPFKPYGGYAGAIAFNPINAEKKRGISWRQIQYSTRLVPPPCSMSDFRKKAMEAPTSLPRLNT